MVLAVSSSTVDITGIKEMSSVSVSHTKVLVFFCSTHNGNMGGLSDPGAIMSFADTCGAVLFASSLLQPEYRCSVHTPIPVFSTHSATSFQHKG